MLTIPRHDTRSAISADLCLAFNLCPALQISRLQQAGCIFGFSDGYKRENGENQPYEDSYLANVLCDLVGIDEANAKLLLVSQNKVKVRFKIIWALLSDHERAIALWMNYGLYNNYWPGFDKYNLPLQSSIHFSTGTPSTMIGAEPYVIPAGLVTQAAVLTAEAYTPNASDADEKAVSDFYQEILELRDLCKILRYSQFQNIGCILARLDYFVSDDKTLQIADDRMAVKLLTLEGVSHDIAQRLVVSRNWPTRFELVWGLLCDYQKSMALTTDYSLFDNFWPGFDIYSDTLEQYVILSSGHFNEIVQNEVQASHSLT